MKAIRIHEYGGTEVLSYDDVPVPEPQEGEVRIKLAAIGVNFIDVYQRTGLYEQELPFIPGLEGAGVVDALGEGVYDLEVGDHAAFAMQPSAYSEYVVVSASKLVPVPDSIDLGTAAAVMLQGMTAHYLTHSTFPLQEGQSVLIHAAAGGVGLLLCQMAKMKGAATVIGTAGTKEKARLAEEAGADHVILYTEQDFVEETRRITSGEGVHVVYDSVGRDTFEGSLDCLRRRGYLVLFGQSSGPVPPTNLEILAVKGSLVLTRPSLQYYMADHDELLWRAKDLFAWIEARKLDARVDRSLPLAEAAAAHRALESRETSGKVLLTTQPHQNPSGRRPA